MQQVADEVGIKLRNYAHWEKGTKAPSRAKLPLLAEALGVSSDWLLGLRSPSAESEPGHETERDVLVQRLDEVLERLERIERALRDR